ncbi:MAG: hypothetical protein IH971_06655 [Candidatus Marinimicrobia bacterium]|nr:hypothetical protein [Candidatus Neomarinimicrobiota bacterium]
MPPSGALLRPETRYRQLEDLASRLGLPVILDRGPFNGGTCLLEGAELIVLNKSTPIEQRTRLLAETLARRDLGEIYIKPALREYLERHRPAESALPARVTG